MSDYQTYEGKRVVVSGCFSGMGEATAKLLLQLGAEVHICGRRKAVCATWVWPSCAGSKEPPNRPTF